MSDRNLKKPGKPASSAFNFAWSESDPELSEPPLVQALHIALASSISHGSLADVEIYLFSRRLRSGGVGKPRAVHANSRILKAASPYFQGLLAGGFSESINVAARDSGKFPALEKPYTDCYGYDDDSDLEDIDDDGDDDNSEGIQKLGLNEGILPDASTDHLLGSGIQPEKLEEPDSVGVAYGSTSTVQTRKGSSSHNMRKIVIKDSAFVTWQWVVLYLYTGHIAFAPLTSQGAEKRQIEREQYHSLNPEYPHPCSPKSMYRLADMLGLDTLKQLALNNIESKLFMNNIYEEIFSTFSARYTAILDLEIRFFDNWVYWNSPTFPEFERKLQALAAGQLPHTVPALASLFKICMAHKGGYCKTPEPFDFGLATTATLSPAAEKHNKHGKP
ncbi:uncharacterized protein FIBRA_04386 [Fibroporia radiculosa]|uniref:BTB domain-containing protein n=1 Tax=Fibroporia radiculosa TaxID=599839 RepID=J4HWI0_9APHY|nr:uncharacterized protein FIBRA_04386 [Fibroporia radiculosa]CCM02297.1 predicted protein [Fibroporia radiculosa]